MPEGAPRTRSAEPAEFADAHDDVGDLARRVAFDRRVLGHPVVLRSMAGAAMAVAILAWPSRTDQILARLIGLALALLGLITIWTARRHRPVDPLRLGGAAVLVAVGVALLGTPPTRADDLLGRGLGVLAIATAAHITIDIGRGRHGERSWPIAQAALLASIGALLLRFPETLLQTAIAMVGLGWLALSLIVIVRSLDPEVDGVSSYPDATSLVAAWLRERPKAADDRQALYGRILYEGPDARARVGRFFTLMTFAAVIASGGIIADSTAVVIGAMLIAPLMTPLMGMAISLVMGWPNRLGRSSLVAAGGIVAAIGIGLVIGLASPTSFDTATNSQILSRISPTTLDLVVAVAAGAAGAYGLSRPDVSDSLPGVAIAISLVPPLTVVGLGLSQGDWGAARGAGLLFATNMLAILIVGGATFVITGVTPIERLAANQHRMRTALAAVAGVAAFVVGALLLNGTEIARSIAIRNDVESAVDAWLELYDDHDAVEVRIDGDTVTVVVIGPSDGSPRADALADRLTTDLGRETTAIVRLVVEERDSATGLSRP